MITFLQALSTFLYSLKTRRSSVCCLVRIPITAAVGTGSGISNVAPGWAGIVNSSGHWSAKTAFDAVNARYPNCPFPRSLCTDDEHAFRYAFKPVSVSYVGVPSTGALGTL